MHTLESKTLNLGKILAKLQSNPRFGEVGHHNPLYVYRLLGAIETSTRLCGSKPDKDTNPNPRHGLLPVSVAREYYEKYTILFEDLAITGVVTLERTHDKNTYLTVNPEYLIGYGRLSGDISEFVEDNSDAPQISSLDLTDAQYNTVDAPMYKAVIRGLKSIAPVNRISLELPEGGLDALRIIEGLDDASWTNQLPHLQAILTGEIRSLRRRDKRCYSTITSLSSSFHKYLRIDGCSLVEIDQGSTYFTILPALMDKEADFLESAPESGKYNETDVELGRYIREEVVRLRRMILDRVDIYEQIAEYSTKPISRSECKRNVCSWICWKSSDKKKTAYKEVNAFFEENFPNITRRLGLLHQNPYTLPSRLNRIESSIFVKASKILNNHGFYCLVKHDCLLVKITDIKDAQAALYCTFAEQRVEMNMKIKDPNGMISPDFNFNGRPHQLTTEMVTPLIRAERIGSDVFETVDSIPNCRDIAKEAAKTLSRIFPRCAKIRLTTKSKGKGKSRLVWEANVMIDKKKWKHTIGFASNQLTDAQLIDVFTAAARADGLKISFMVVR